MTQVGFRDFPKFMAFIELINDPKKVKALVKEMSEESARLEKAVEDLGIKEKLKNGLDTLEAIEIAGDELREKNKVESKRINELIESGVKIHNDQMSSERKELDKAVREMQDASGALEIAIEDHADEYSKKSAALAVREDLLYTGQAALKKEQEEWKAKLEIINSAGV